jgi:hypothetical protein
MRVGKGRAFLNDGHNQEGDNFEVLIRQQVSLTKVSPGWTAIGDFLWNYYH